MPTDFCKVPVPVRLFAPGTVSLRWDRFLAVSVAASASPPPSSLLVLFARLLVASLLRGRTEAQSLASPEKRLQGLVARPLNSLVRVQEELAAEEERLMALAENSLEQRRKNLLLSSREVGIVPLHSLPVEEWQMSFVVERLTTSVDE